MMRNLKLGYFFTDGMLFRANNVLNNERYRYVISSFKDDEKSSLVVHKIYITDALFITAEGRVNVIAGRMKNKTLSRWGYSTASIEL